MKNNIIKISAGVILLIVMVLLISRLRSEDEPFKQIVLSTNNLVTNNVYPMYYDTVLMVAMDQMGIIGHTVVINKLTDGAKSQFDGELKAHIRYHNGIFYLFTEEFDRKESIEVLCHEVIHIQQYTTGNLIYEDGFVIWLGEPIELNSIEYEKRPWEDDAFLRQGELIGNVEKVLYND